MVFRKNNYYLTIEARQSTVYKHASLACAARLADTACPQIYPVGAWEYTSLSCFILSTLDCHLSTVTLMKSEL